MRNRVWPQETSIPVLYIHSEELVFYSYFIVSIKQKNEDEAPIAKVSAVDVIKGKAKHITLMKRGLVFSDLLATSS